MILRWRNGWIWYVCIWWNEKVVTSKGNATMFGCFVECIDVRVRSETILESTKYWTHVEEILRVKVKRGPHW